MCGIAGIVTTDSSEKYRSSLEAMSDILKQRGPDASGLWISGNFGFVHRRLRVLDLAPQSDQPMFSDDKKLIIVFNGEVYNFKELRDRLTKLGARFKTTSDTEVILKAYEHWGVQSFKELNGIFAFAIADLRANHKMVLVRDSIGVKPLYYSSGSQGFSFSSDLRTFFKLPFVDTNIDKQSLFWFLKFSHVPCPNTILKGVKQLEPGNYLELEDNNATIHSYKPANQSTYADFTNGSKDQVFEQVLQNSVQRQLCSDVPLGIFLSGGLDSSLILSEVVKVNPNVETFTIAYEEEKFDESSAASLVANHFNVKHTKFVVKQKDFLDEYENLFQKLDQPLADPTIIPTMILCKNSRSKITVALSGDGGDELFFGYKYQEVLWWLNFLRYVPASVKNIFLKNLQSLILKYECKNLNRFIKVLTVLQFSNDEEFLQNFIGTFGPIPLNDLYNLLGEKVKTDVNPRFSPLKRLNLNECDPAWWKKIELAFLKTFLLDTVLAKSDRCGMAYGLEIRVPFLDNEMFAFSNQLDFSDKYKPFFSKAILRNCAKKRLPKPIFQQKKRGFSIPLESWTRDELKPFIFDLLVSKKSTELGFFDSKQIQYLLHQHESKVINHSHLIWSLTTFIQWYNTNKG